MTSSQPYQAGAIINERYTIKSHLGSGGYGEVLAAHDLLEDRPVALKLLHADAALNDPRAAVRMRQEAEILRAIDHPNIVRIFEVGSVNGDQFLVMEHIDGVGLDEILLRDGQLQTQRLLPILRQLLLALDAAHRTKILHRDLKPENILISVVDEVEVVKLVDFGIAKAGASLNADDPDDAITLVKTQVGNFVGTPRYASPEMIVGDPLAPSADLFCVGLVVYEALIGEPLLNGTTHSDFMNALIVPRPFDLDALPELWQQWLAPMLEKSPDRRIQSAKGALDRLAQIFSLEVDVDDSSPDDVDLATDTWEQPTQNSQLFEPIQESDSWKHLDIDYRALEENRIQARQDAARVQQQQNARLPSRQTPGEFDPSPAESSKPDKFLIIVVVALLGLAFLVALLLWLPT